MFIAAVAEAAAELARLIRPTAEGTPLEKLGRSLDAYLGWIEANARVWSTLMRSLATLPEARDALEGFRARTMAHGPDRADRRRRAAPGA
ncbi:MAG: hypothetical protein LC720_04610 [Actinobacteria bacterium]|nr:hypothetical protein [Actinomycetota bacterium]